MNIIKAEIDGTCMLVTDFIRNFDLHIDSDLRFDVHINKVINSAFGNLKIIYGNKHYFNSATRKILCNILVLFHLNYYLIVYVCISF